MNTYKIKLKFESGIFTPLQADTVFGHLCWIIAHREGAEELQKFLKPFLDSTPPFIISDAFPADYFPKPISIELKAKDNFKDIKKINWVEIGDFNRIRKGEVFMPSEIQTSEKLSASTHNTIDRLTNTTMSEVGVYSIKETFISEVSVYVKVISEEWKDKVDKLFRDLSKTGYGRKKSIGKGQFSVIEMQEYKFAEIENADGFVTLSNFCPAIDDPTEGLYKTFVKYGKLGEEFTFCGNPFKKPLLVFRTGSVFKTNAPPKEYYGRMVNKIAPAKENKVVQYAYAFTLPVQMGGICLKQ